jgi:glycosyltransferase involved in cell wall biosynthesis
MHQNPSNTPLVSIACITYNQAAFIREAIEGFLMQKTNFCFEIIIHDDASTDGTDQIIREYELQYPDLIFPIYQTENQYSKGVRRFLATFLLPQAKGKYIAFCEGDDYWIDQYKLQKQVDFLEANPEYGLVCTDFNKYYQTEGKMEYALFKNQPEQFPIYSNLEAFLLNKGYMAPCSWLAKKECFFYTKIDYADGSFAILMDIFANTKVHVLPEVTVVYRILDESASNVRSGRNLYLRHCGIFMTQLEYIEKYHLSKELKKQVTINYYQNLINIIIYNDDDASFILNDLSNQDTSFFVRALFGFFRLKTVRMIFRIFHALKKRLKHFCYS